MQVKQWQYGMNIVFGLLLLCLPWLLGFSGAIPIKGWGFFLVGTATATVALAAAALHMRSRVGEFGNLILGLWMIVYPRIIGFAGNTVARDGAILLGAMVFLMALWARLERRHELPSAARY